MLKNIIFIFMSMTALVVSPEIWSADGPAGQEAIPAGIVSAEPETATTLTGEPAVLVAKPIRQSVSSSRPENDNHTDYRYCLELKTNIEIAQCRYKKK